MIKSHTIQQYSDAEIVNPTKAKTWFYFNEYGAVENVKVDKYTLATKLQIPLRDMRVLDPLFPTPYPSAIFLRDYSIVLNLEHIKLIACQDQVWLLDSNKAGGSFSPDSLLSLDRLVRALSVTLRVKESANNVSCNSSFHEMQETLYRKWSKKISHEQKLTQEETMHQLLSVDLKLPFELRAVEAALFEFTRYLDENVIELEGEAVVALDRLSKQVSRATLETIRAIKSNMNGLFARVSKTREELERLLDDDDDMANMHLGEIGGSFNMDSPHLQRQKSKIPESPIEAIYSPRHMPRRRGHVNKKKYSKMASLASAKSQGVPFYEVWQQREIDEVEAVEAFLEVYFLKSDFLMKRLSVLKEKIDDTEDLINIDLDFRRNELFKVDILLTTGTLSMGLVSAIAGIFGMNLQSGGEDDETDKSYMYFVLVALVSSGGCILLFVGLALYLKSRKLMFVSESNIVSNDRRSVLK